MAGSELWPRGWERKAEAKVPKLGGHKERKGLLWREVPCLEALEEQGWGGACREEGGGSAPCHDVGRLSWG